jgi:hypothetical protein
VFYKRSLPNCFRRAMISQFCQGPTPLFPTKTAADSTSSPLNQRMGKVCVLVPSQLMSAPFPNHINRTANQEKNPGKPAPEQVLDRFFPGSAAVTNKSPSRPSNDPPSSQRSSATTQSAAKATIAVATCANWLRPPAESTIAVLVGLPFTTKVPLQAAATLARGQAHSQEFAVKGYYKERHKKEGGIVT